MKDQKEGKEECGYMILTPTPEHNGGMWCAEKYPCKRHGGWRKDQKEKDCNFCKDRHLDEHDEHPQPSFEEIKFSTIATQLYLAATHPEAKNSDDFRMKLRNALENAYYQGELHGVAEHDAKWHPINDKMQMENLHGYKEGYIKGREDEAIDHLQDRI